MAAATTTCEFVTMGDLEAARSRVAGVALRTPLVRLDPDRLREAGAPVPPFGLSLKAESLQPIGSFKLRGAYNMIAGLDPVTRARGVITYSSGNHAQGVAFAARALGTRAVIVMPGDAPTVKIDATHALGAEIVFTGNASSERRARAEALAAEHGYVMIPPYDDRAIVAGQGTCGLEILEQQPDVDLVLSPVSGGGLLSGIATAIKLSAEAGLAPRGVHVCGAEPALAADAKESFETRTLVEWPAAKTTRTVGDGLRTQSLGVINFGHILRYVDGIVAISEAEILESMRVIMTTTDLVPEPSGAVSLAAALFHPAELPPAHEVVAVLSGGNLDPALRSELEAELAARRSHLHAV